MGANNSRYHRRDLHWNAPPSAREVLSAYGDLHAAIKQSRRPDMAPAEKDRLQRRAEEKLRAYQSALREDGATTHSPRDEKKNGAGSEDVLTRAVLLRSRAT